MKIFKWEKIFKEQFGEEVYEKHKAHQDSQNWIPGKDDQWQEKQWKARVRRENSKNLPCYFGNLKKRQ